MKKSLLFILATLLTVVGFAQNFDFENWTQDTILNLDEYQTSVSDHPMYGQDAIFPSTDCTDGNYSVRLETILSPENDTIFGYFTNGDPDNFSGGTPTSLASIDSVVGYYKYDIQPGDTALFLCMAKYNGAPAGGNVFTITGTQSTWIRFSYPVLASSVDSVIIAAASSNAINEIGITPGSYIMFDNIQLKSNTLGMEQIPNYSFENWSNIIWEDLAGWNTPNHYIIGYASTPVEKTTDAFSGSYAARLNTIFFPEWNDTLIGYISYGEWTQTGPTGGFPYTDQPDSVQVHYKSSFTGNDTAYFQFTFKKMGTPIAYNGTAISQNQSSYTLFSQAVNLPQAPDTVFIWISSGNNPGSQIIVDDIEFLFPVGNNEIYNIHQVVSFPNPASDNLYFNMNFEKSNDVNIDIYNMEGKLLSCNNFKNLYGYSKVSVNISDLPKGNYIYKVSVDNKVYTKTFIKN